MNNSELRLDIGCGPRGPRPGFIGVDRLTGSDAFPLAFSDGTVSEIVASHILEHFAHGQITSVLADWVRVLKPGGRLRIAVPDFAKLAEAHKRNMAPAIQPYLMGGQTDENDFHKSIFDEFALKLAMAQAGLVLLRPWVSEHQDCAALSISLNIEGRKPSRSEAKIAGCMTCPRLGFNDMWNSAILALPALGIEFTRVSGAFWDQCFSMVIDRVLADGPDYVLAMDYDSVFSKAHVARLIETALVYDEADALAPLQASRHNDKPLFGIHGQDGQKESDVARSNIEADIYPVRQAHFGLTLLKADLLRDLPKPWFISTPNAAGEWAEGKLDADIHFWRTWERAGHSAYIAPRVVIGHLELMVRWPGQNMEPVWQSTRDWESSYRAPPQAWTGFSDES